MTKILKMLALLALVTLPGAAMAGDAGTWTLYTTGNGELLYTILNAVSMMMMEGGYQQLMKTLAGVAIFTLAINAGLSPSTGAPKMVGYFVLIVILVTISRAMPTTVIIEDPVNPQMTAKPAQKIPAIVAVPASVISQVGHYLSGSIEKNFLGPYLDGFTVTATHRFNLANQLVADAGQFRIQDPATGRSLSSYVGDCIVPAIARGDLHVRDLVRGAKFIGTAPGDGVLGKGAMGAWLTVYTPPAAGMAAACTAAMQPGEMPTGTYYDQVVSCQTAYTCLAADLAATSAEILSADAAAWGKSGAFSSLGSALDTLVAHHQMSGYSGGADLIKQSAVLGSLTGAFRDAAVKSGNSELLTGIAISSAEQQQVSAWVAGAQLFQKFAPYVWTMLQAFSLAIIPLMALALVIPGFGKTIAINYVQIALWLAMWEPLLVIVNFLMTFYGVQELSPLLAGGAGLTMQNRVLVSEAASNLQIAGGFLAASTPMIAWGLVKGSIAFTEVIKSGTGAQFAASAGSTAATGNVSLNNTNMDSISANKINTASQGTFGSQATIAHMSAGAGLIEHDLGGERVSQAGAPITKQVTSSTTSQKQAQLSSMLSEQSSLQTQLAVMDAVGAAQGWTGSVGDSFTAGKTAGQQSGQNWSKNKGFRRGDGFTTDTSVGEGAGTEQAKKSGLTASMKAGLPGGGNGPGSTGGAGGPGATVTPYDKTNAAKTQAQTNTTRGKSRQVGTEEAGTAGDTYNQTLAAQQAGQHTVQGGQQSSAQRQWSETRQALQARLSSLQTTIAETRAWIQSQGTTVSGAVSMDVQEAQAALAGAGADPTMQRQIAAGGAGLAAGRAALAADAGALQAGAGAGIRGAEAQAKAWQQQAAAQGGALAGPNAGPAVSGFATGYSAASAERAAGAGQVDALDASLRGAVGTSMNGALPHEIVQTRDKDGNLNGFRSQYDSAMLTAMGGSVLSTYGPAAAAAAASAGSLPAVSGMGAAGVLAAGAGAWEAGTFVGGELYRRDILGGDAWGRAVDAGLGSLPDSIRAPIDSVLLSGAQPGYLNNDKANRSQ